MLTTNLRHHLLTPAPSNSPPPTHTPHSLIKGRQKFATSARNPDTTNETAKNSFVDSVTNPPPDTSPLIAKITLVIIVNKPPPDTFIKNARREQKIWPPGEKATPKETIGISF